MSGHSKWATTKRRKAAVDAKRGQIFTKLAKLITIAVRDGDTDPNTNPNLRVAIDNARSFSMPKENIERAIQRGAGGDDSIKIEEIVYEAYGPGGIALIIECLTDNKNRAIAEIKSILNKFGGSIAGNGSVVYKFKKIGQIIISQTENSKTENSLTTEQLEEEIINSDADDFEKEDNTYIVYTNQNNLHQVKRKLEERKVKVESAELIMVPLNYIDISEEKKDSAINLLEALDDLEDVNKVFTNISI